MDVNNNGMTMSRQFYFTLPTGYAAKRPYRLIFAWHDIGGMASAIASTDSGGNYYGLLSLLPDAIYVAPQGLLTTAGNPSTSGWSNTNGQDVAFAKAMVGWFETNFCVDPGRIMSVGFSAGGIMTDTLGCQMSDVFRAIGVMSGEAIATQACATHAIAAWMTHGDSDTTIPISGGQQARDGFLKVDGCATSTKSVNPSPCLQYNGCIAGYPVVWCPVTGGTHNMPAFAPSAIADFFTQF
jgi:polyhydroxybutyrate depolymerase